jgi:hypothetical protein
LSYHILFFAFQERICGPNWDEQIIELRLLHEEEFHSLYPSATTRVGLVEMDHRYAHKILVKDAIAEIYIYIYIHTHTHTHLRGADKSLAL